MVVDDEPEVLDLIINILDLRGFSVSGFSDAETAEQAFESGSFDVLLSDVVLQGKSGIELAQHCVGVDSSLGVVLVSGFLPNTLPKINKEWTFVSKPFTAESLVSAIRKTIIKG